MNNFFEGLQKALVGLMAAVTGATGVVPATIPAQTSPATPPETVNQQEMVTKSGQYTYSGQTVTYTLNIPKNGGKVTGSLGGFCSGQINADFAGGEGGNIKGTVNPSCGIAFLRFSTLVNYSGNLYLEGNNADLDWEGNIPSTPGRGSVRVPL